MSAVIQTHDLCKVYGKVLAVDGVDLEVHEGEVFGYLGPNGAGKTTTIRILLDYIRPTRGSATIFGLDSVRDSVEIRRRVGYLPGEMALYDRATGREWLEYAFRLRGRADWAFARELAERLDADLDRRFSTLSRGNRQKVGLVQALAHRPALVVFDEPTAGLDPLVQHEFYRLVEETKAEGRTVFLSSHNLPEVERTCDRVGIIRRGRLVAVEDVAVLKGRALHRMEVRFAGPVSPESFAGLPGVEEVSVEDSLLRCSIKGSPDAVVKAAARYEVVRLTSQEPSLEEVFLAYYGEGGDDAR